jgi:DHA1 family inner membrane transport protein
LFGVGGLIGMQVGGRAADRNLIASIIGVFVATIVVYFVLLFAFYSAPLALIMMFVWGASGYFMAAPIQVRVVDSGRAAPNLASTLLQSSFNLGIAFGPFTAAVALSLGMSFARLPLVGAAFAAAGLAIALALRELDRRAAPVAAG